MIDDIHVKGSPYSLKALDNFNKRYLSYIRDNENGAFQNSEIVNIDRGVKENKVNKEIFFESLLKSFPKGIKGKAPTIICYEKEPGVDAGGLTKDFFECLGIYAMDPQVKIFEKCGDKYRIHPDSNQKMLKVYGKALANGITHRQKIPISLCNSLIKLLLNLPLTDNDLEEECPETYKGLNDLMTYSQDELEISYLNFTVNQGGRSIPLKKNGELINVSIDNRQEYYNLMVQWELKNYAKYSVDSFIKGFFIVAKPLINLFIIDEVRFIICGLDPSFIEIIEKKIECSNTLEKQKKWLIRWLTEKGAETAKKFLKFSTASSLIPVGIENWKIKLRVKYSNNIEKADIPLAHTCFNAIDFPLYETYEILSERMDFVMAHLDEGFQMA